jgi:hypothetical protein
MTDKDPHPSDYGYIDDVVSLAIVLSVLVALLTVIGGSIFLVYSGVVASDLSITGEIRIVGTIPIWLVIGLMGGGVAWVGFLAFRDIYGSDAVREATETVQELGEEEE